jgi:hypothetical protein
MKNLRYWIAQPKRMVQGLDLPFLARHRVKTKNQSLSR